MRKAQDKFIQKGIKRPGALREYFGVKEGEKIPVEKARAEYKKLTEKAKGDKKLSESEGRLRDQLQLYLKTLLPAAKKKEKGSKKASSSLRSRTIRLAAEKPHLREHLLPLLVEDGSESS